MKELLTDEHKLYRLAFAEGNVDRKWDRVIFTDESTFTSANDGPVLVYRFRLQIMMATVRHVTSSSGLRKFQTDGFLFVGVYNSLADINISNILCIYMPHGAIE